jgi:hypothetical protein
MSRAKTSHRARRAEGAVTSGQAVHARDDRDQAVRLIGTIPQRQMEPRDIGGSDLFRGLFPQLRNEMVVRRRRVLGGRARLALGLGVVVDEVFDELRDGHSGIRLRPLLGGVLPTGYRAQNGFGLGARFVGRDRAVSAQHHEAAQTGASGAARSIADDVGFGPALGDPDPKPLQIRSQTK